MTDSGDRSSEVAEDVNLCDICGDVGEEDKLAICSRCNDGAEHTYCMKVMIDEVPEGEWLCGECQAEVEIEIEKKKLEISQVKAGTISSENNVEAELVGNKEPNNACHCNGTSSKRKELNAGIFEAGCTTCDDTSTQRVENGVSCVGGSETVNRDKASHDREQTSTWRRTSNNLRSLDRARHILERCNDKASCNLEVKDAFNVAAMNRRLKIQSEVILCDICGDVGEKKKLAVCSRCNDGAEHTYCMPVMVEDIPDIGWLCESCQIELQTEMFNTKLKDSQLKIGASKGELIDVKVNKLANDASAQSSSQDEVDVKYFGRGESKRRNHASLVGLNSPEPGGLSIEADSRKGVLLSHECSFNIGTEKGKHATSQAPTSLASNALKNKARPLHGPLSKSISFNSSKIPKVKQLLSEVPLKPKHSKEPSYSTKQVGPMSMSPSFKNSNFCDPAHKAKALIKPNAVETGVLNPLMRQNMKNNRDTYISGRPSVSASMATLVPSPAESAPQHLTEGNNMVESSYVSIAHRQGNKTLGHNEVHKPLSAKAPESVTLSSVETSVGILGSDAARKAVQSPYPSHLDYKPKNPCLRLNVKHHDTVSAIKGRSVDSPTMSSDLGDNSLNFSSQLFSPGYEQLAWTAPELNHIWQGGFELWRTGGSPELCDGFQAHLSCSASPKLLELAKKFPSKIQLEELPRQNVWPLQFQENCPTYDSIGLFFFARDIQSYEYYYSKLVENIIKGDLALRGNIETAELLIFASNTLPKNCQRWNSFIFLWGVMRVRRNDPLSLPLDVPKLVPHQDKLLGSSDFNGGEVTLDMLTTPVQCSDSTIHEDLNNAEHHMGVDHVKSSAMISSKVEQFSRTSNGEHKRNVEVANWNDETSDTLERKKTKLDGRTSGNSALQVK